MIFNENEVILLLELINNEQKKCTKGVYEDEVRYAELENLKDKVSNLYKFGDDGK